MARLEPEAPWIGQQDLDTWLAYLTSSRLLVSELDRRLRKDAGISHAWYAILAVLASQPNKTYRQTDLASLADFSLSRLSYVITKLEERGWVRREPSADDGRATNVVLTHVGIDALAAAAEQHAKAIEELFLDRLTSAQRKALRQACTALMPALPGAPKRLLPTDD